jgi:prephenate dehydrogenase
MCGKETSGIESADPGLYEGATFILTPLPRTSEGALSLGRELATVVGSHPLVLSAERQDFLVGTMSHLPYLMACALVATADATTSADPAAWRIVAGGFRDTTRVAGSDVTMMTDILLTNPDEVLRALDVLQEQIRRLSRMVDSAEEEEMRATLSAIRQMRLEMYP